MKSSSEFLWPARERSINLRLGRKHGDGFDDLSGMVGLLYEDGPFHAFAFMPYGGGARNEDDRESGIGRARAARPRSHPRRRLGRRR